MANSTARKLSAENKLCYIQGNIPLYDSRLQESESKHEGVPPMLFWQGHNDFWFFLTEIYKVPTGPNEWNYFKVKEYTSILAHITMFGGNYITSLMGRKEAKYFAIARNMWLGMTDRAQRGGVMYIAETARDRDDYIRTYKKALLAMPQWYVDVIPPPKARCLTPDSIDTEELMLELESPLITFNVYFNPERHPGEVWTAYSERSHTERRRDYLTCNLTSAAIHYDPSTPHTMPDALKNATIIPWNDAWKKRSTSDLLFSLGQTDILIHVK